MQKIVTFFSQIASNILKFCKCVNLCLRFKETASAVKFYNIDQDWCNKVNATHKTATRISKQVYEGV